MEEMKDLKKIYEDRVKEIREEMGNYQLLMMGYMKEIVTLDDERKELNGKLWKLRQKMGV